MYESYMFYGTVTMSLFIIDDRPVELKLSDWQLN